MPLLRFAFILLLMTPALVQAQARFAFGARASVLPLYDGDATIGARKSWATTVHAALLLGPTRTGELELFYTISPGEETRRNPDFQLAGLLFNIHRGVESAVSGVGSIGFGLIDVSARTQTCLPPLCFSEGGPSFRDATLATAIGALGLDVRLLPVLRLRLDTRAHLPLGGGDDAAESGKLRLEFGAGLRVIL